MIRQFDDLKMRRWEGEKMRKFENLKVRECGAGFIFIAL